MDTSIIENFNALRLVLEVQVASPAVIVVTAATAKDGTAFAAFGLADCLAAAGHRTLLLRADSREDVKIPVPIRKTGDERHSPRMIGDHHLHVLDAIDERIAAAASRDAVAAALDRLRAEYAYIIVDAGALPNRCLASTLATLAEATLLALCAGRSRSSADAALAKACEVTAINVLGVVKTTRKSIKSFDKLEIVEVAPKPRFVGIGNVAAQV